MSSYWLHPKIENQVEFVEHVEIICDLYADAPVLHKQGVHVVSVDEMTGIQAVERIAPPVPLAPGRVERREFAYKRHGTLSLIANFMVATGQVVAPSIGPTRTEADFAAHLGHTVATDPTGEWVFIADQLNTHQSATLVEWVAKECQIAADLGEKEKRGVLETMASRAAFLSDPTHRIRFVYTPKHCSWLNQIEIWFSILVRRLLKRGNFTSLANLQEQILVFIAYFNRTLAKAFKWTYTGRPLVA